VSRKLFVFCVLLAVVFIAVIGWFFYHLLQPGAGNVSNDGYSDGRTEVICAVPVDAVTLYRTRSLSDAKGVLSSFAPDYLKVLSVLPGEGFGYEGSLSVHSTGKNKLSLLMVCVIPETTDCDSIMRCMLGRCAGVIQKKYDSSIIYRSSVPEINFSLYGRFFLCSSSPALLESSMRLLDSGESLFDNPTFVDVIKDIRSSGYIVFNHNVIGKLISGVTRPKFRKVSAFASHITDWSSFEISSIEDDGISGTGKMAQFDEKGCYSYVLGDQKGAKSDLTDILPYNTVGYTSVRISDLELFVSRYTTFKYSLGRKKSSGENLVSLAEKAGLSEVARVRIALPEAEENVVLLKTEKPQYFTSGSEVVDSCAFPGVASAVAGRFFEMPDSSASCALSGGWVVIGSWRAVRWYLNAGRNVNFFSLSDWLSQTPVKSIGGRNTIISSMMNLSLMSDSVGTVLAEPFAASVKASISNHNLNIFTFSVNAESGSAVPHYALYSTNLDRMPTLKNSVTMSAAEDEDTVIAVNQGPYTVVDFRNGKKNTLEQLPDAGLRLLDDRGRELWNIPFEGKICGSVSQIDYLKNNKLQMLFASGTKIYLKTRLGGDVKPYPVETGKEILLGPQVYDLNSDREYLFEILHSDNTVVFYDRDGNKASGFGEITAPERMTVLPEPIRAGSQLYWAVRTSAQTIIVNSDGIPVANFNRKRRLACDTEITVLSDDEMQVTTADGKILILNVVTGEFRKQ